MICEANLIEKGLNLFKQNEQKYRSIVGRVSDQAMLERIKNLRKAGNPTHTVFCNTCRIYHPIFSNNYYDLLNAVSDFKQKHLKHELKLSSVPIWSKEGWISNADVKESFQAEQTFTTTNLQSLASSATAGWCSASVDNTSNLYLNALVAMVIAAVNTAPANNQTIYLYTYSGTNSTDLTTTGTSGGTVGTEGTLTFPSISTPLQVLMPMIGIIPYPVQNKALNAGPYSVAKAFDGILSPYWGIALVNFSGFTFASSGNTAKYRGVYSTVV